MTLDSASLKFVLFGLAVAVISNLSRSRAWRATVLLLASIVFLGLLEHDSMAFLPLAGFLLLGYACLQLRRGWAGSLVWSIVAIVFVYIWLKKYAFLPEASFLRFPYLTLGLSYIFFRMLSLVIDAESGPGAPRIGFGAYLLYAINFTTLVSGPIQRYDEFARDQFARQPIALGPRVVALQLERIVRGFFKFNVLAMLFDMMRVDAFADLSQPLPAAVKFYAAFRVVVLYPFFLYCNFSGYIDIVIGLARLMRVRLPENFNRPFSASSFLDFWNRWHITLSHWLRAYVYQPLLLALMRRTSSRALKPLLGVLCYFVTFFLMGLWHGRTSEFIWLGILMGAGASVNKLWQLGLAGVLGSDRYRKIAKNIAYVSVSRGLTFTWYALTTLLLWADWKQLHGIVAAIGVAPSLGVVLAVWLMATVVLELWEVLRSALLSIRNAEGPVITNRYARVVYAAALGLAAFVMTVLLNQPAPGIVYKVF